MLSATEASKLSVESRRKEAAASAASKRADRLAYSKELERRNPKRIEEAERSISATASRGERSTELGFSITRQDFIDPKRFAHSIPRLSDLLKPLQEFFAHFEHAGYKISFRDDYEDNEVFILASISW